MSTNYASNNLMGRTIEDPPFARFFFSDVRSSWIWLILRLWLGYAWIEASLHKISDPAWVSTGEALKGFWTNAVKIPEQGRPAIAYDWYRNFIAWLLDREAYTWFGPLVAYAEMMIGIALIVGVFVGIAAFFGAFMNWNFIMAGAASTNGMLMIVAMLLMLAWKVAGYFGADYFLLGWLGVPWKGGETEQKHPMGTPQLKPQAR